MIDLGTLIVAILSLLVAIVSLIKSFKAERLQAKINEIELKIKEYELNQIKKEENDKNKVIVDANIINIYKSNYKLRICNLSSKPIYEVIAHINEENNIIVVNDGVMPFEILEPKKSFELPLLVHNGSKLKFDVVIKCRDEENNWCENKFIRTL